MAASVLAREGTDPSAFGADLAWQTPGSTGVLSRGGQLVRLEGTHPALGGGLLAQRVGDTVRLTHLETGGVVAAVPAVGSGPLGVSARWLVERVVDASGDRLEALSLADGMRRAIAQVRAPVQLGRPSVDGDRVVFHEAGRSGARLWMVDLPSGTQRLLRRRDGAQLLNPALRDGRLAYVHATAERQKLRAGRLDGDDRTVYDIPPTVRRDAGHEPGRGRHRAGYPGGRPRRLPERPPPGIVRTLWTTALTDGGAVVARLSHQPDGSTAATLLQVSL